jgi:Rrf2 family protein
MNINQESDYAFRIVLMLCKEGLDNKLDAKSLSEKGNIPLRFLLKLTRKLTQSGIVKSYRGVNGGYAISKDAKDISLKDVVEAIQALCVVQNNMLNELEKVNFEQLKNDPW